jgi:hypothetical protein
MLIRKKRREGDNESGEGCEAGGKRSRSRCSREEGVIDNM